MDVFFEQIIHKKPSLLQKILKIAIIVASIALIISLLFFAVSMLSTIFPPIIVLLAVGVGFGARWYVKRMYLEYEYSLTNGDFDIDRIWGKSKRERVISTNCKDFEEIGPYNEKTMRRLRPIEFDAKVIAANLDEEGLFYITANHKVGLVLIILQPDERLKEGFKKFVPRFIQNGVDWN